MIYLDSDVAIALTHGHLKLENLKQLFDTEAQLAITSLSMYEIYNGWYSFQLRKKDRKSKAFLEKERKAIDALKQKLIHVPFSVEAARRGAEIFNTLASRGKIIGVFNCMIAGVILANGHDTILTGNADHFNRIEELTVIVPELKP